MSRLFARMDDLRKPSPGRFFVVTKRFGNDEKIPYYHVSSTSLRYWLDGLLVGLAKVSADLIRSLIETLGTLAQDFTRTMLAIRAIILAVLADDDTTIDPLSSRERSKRVGALEQGFSSLVRGLIIVVSRHTRRKGNDYVQAQT
jgi:hypothetical protein